LEITALPPTEKIGILIALFPLLEEHLVLQESQEKLSDENLLALNQG
jgi:hypothetical protein